jgi:hypothetical protein
MMVVQGNLTDAAALCCGHKSPGSAVCVVLLDGCGKVGAKKIFWNENLSPCAIPIYSYRQCFRIGTLLCPLALIQGLLVQVDDLEETETDELMDFSLLGEDMELLGKI